MLLMMAVAAVILWTLGFVVLHVPSGPVHLLLAVAVAALAAHFAWRRPSRRRVGGTINNLSELEDGGDHRPSLRLQSDGHGRSIIS